MFYCVHYESDCLNMLDFAAEHIPEHRLLATCSADRTIAFWSTAQPKAPKALRDIGTAADTSGDGPENTDTPKEPVDEDIVLRIHKNNGVIAYLECVTEWLLPRAQLAMCWTGV